MAVKKWVVLGTVLALALTAGAAWAVARRDGSERVAVPSLKERVAALPDGSSPEQGLLLDRCFELRPVSDGSGALNPELAAFPARLLDDTFELTAVRFGDLCFRTPQVRMLETEWKHRETGVEVMIDQYAGTDAPTRVATNSASFNDDGFDFYILGISELLHPHDAVDVSIQSGVLETAVQQLGPPVSLSCFYRTTGKSWGDLAAFGIGDPRPAVPSDYTPLNLEFTVLEPPPADCPGTKSPPAAESSVQFRAMFNGPGSSLLAVSARAVTPEDGESQATFGAGDARWQAEHYQFSINWAPEHVSNDEARTIATALDPGFGKVCSLSVSRVNFDDIRQTNLREPVRADGPSTVSGSFFVIGNSPGCPDGGATGFQAHWIMEYRDRGGLVDVTALRGEQMPNLRPFVFEDKTLYWQRSDGVEFYVSGLKAEFARAELLQVARGVDPTFDERMLTSPPKP